MTFGKTRHPHSKITLGCLDKYPNLVVMDKNNQVVSLHTMIRNRDCPRNDFIFYSNRLIRLLLETAIAELEYKEKTVVTPTGDEFVGTESAMGICGVSILRAGESMEGPLRDIAKSVRIGKILIQRDESSEDKHAVLFYSKLPEDIQERQVLLLDPMLATGGSAKCAIQCVLDAGVPEDRITFVNLVSCPEGLDALFQSYPKLKVVTSQIDDKLNEDKYILPGLGDFGDRYFGTK